MKTCYICKQEFPATAENFSANKSAKDGLSAYCKPCHRAKRREWLKTHKEVVKGYRKARTAKNRRIRLQPYLSGISDKDWLTKAPEAQSRAYTQFSYHAITSHTDKKINEQEFFRITSAPCHFCNTTETHHRVSRLQPHIPYTVDNTVSCCPTCLKKRAR